MGHSNITSKKKLLIHDLSTEDWNRVSDNFKDWTVISDNGEIRPCIGCFKCWTGGTGECVIRDGYEHMGSLIHRADEVVVMSRYTYGGFSSFVKNVFDRSLGYVLPEFETAYGEMHHKKRYSETKPVTFRFRGARITASDREKAERYVSAVCRNLRGTVKEVFFDECGTEEPETESVCNEAARSGILCVDCSPRGERSNTRAFLKSLQAGMENPSDMLSLTPGTDLDKIADAVGNAETVVMGVPLYVDGIPSTAVRLMEIVRKRGAGKDCRLYAVVHNGLYESNQNDNMLSMLRDWAEACGSYYCGALAIGAGEVVGPMMDGKRASLWPARNALTGLAHIAECISTGIETETTYADPFMFPRWLYILIANVNWQRLKRLSRKNGF